MKPSGIKDIYFRVRLPLLLELLLLDELELLELELLELEELLLDEPLLVLDEELEELFRTRELELGEDDELLFLDVE
jgi:hypothetical protein